ncbi:MAG: ABC transporter ATP-binding protein [Chloroflexota bacterium]
MQIILRGFGYLRPYSRWAIGAFVSMLIVTASNLVTPQLVRQLIDNGIEVGSWNGILLATGGLLGVAIFRGVFSYTNAYWSETASQGIAFDMRNDIYRKLESLSFSYHDSHQTGQLMTRATSDVEGVRNFFAQGLLQLISAILTFAGSIIILFATEWRLALAALSTIPLIIIIFVVLFRRMGPLFGIVQKNLGLLNNILQESITGVRVVKAFAAESRELERYNTQNDTLYGLNIQIVQNFSLGFPTIFLLANLGTLIVMWYGGNLVISEQLSLGTLIAFNGYLAFLLMPIFQLGGLSQQVARASALSKRLFEVLDEENEIVEKPDAIKLDKEVFEFTHVHEPGGIFSGTGSGEGDGTGEGGPQGPHTHTYKQLPGRVTFKNVSFRYKGSEEYALKNISFDVMPGQTVALLGGTGSGKSTIVNLIPRFYDVTEGRVLLDGVDVRDVKLDHLRREVGNVLQDVNLISGTIRDNITFGRPGAKDRPIQVISKLAQAYDFIMELPDGFDTEVGERGAGLSGGQRQRIAIARALLTRPSILIFDDSMSALDAETEHNLREALAPLLSRKTTFIIAQRISTVQNADLILLVDDGEIVAQGTHEALLETSALYNEILHSQLDDDTEEPTMETMVDSVIMQGA